MGSIENVCDILGKICRDSAGSGQMVQCLSLVETGHFDRPFDYRTVSANLKSLWAARDRNHTAVNLWRVAPVDGEFLLAGTLALVECRVVQEGEPYCTLDLQDPILFQEHDRRVGIDTRHCCVVNPAAKKSEHVFLVWLRGVWLRRVHHGRSTAAPTSFPCRSRVSASLACFSGKTVVRVWIFILPAALKKSNPSFRVRLATETI